LVFIERKKIKRGAGSAAAKNFKISTIKLVQTPIIQRHQQLEGTAVCAKPERRARKNFDEQSDANGDCSVSPMT
jgi:hypothetical protein